MIIQRRMAGVWKDYAHKWNERDARMHRAHLKTTFNRVYPMRIIQRTVTEVVLAPATRAEKQ